MARSITNPDRQAQALAAVAEALARPAARAGRRDGRPGQDRGPLHH